MDKFIPDRSEQAFKWTCRAFNRYAESNKQKLYFWTFTFVKKMPDPWYSYRWAGFIREVLDMYRDEMPLYGVKVTEPHRRALPGAKWRGLHFHCVINHRVPVGEVRRIGKRYGVGRIQVKRVWDKTGVESYLGKYLGKQFRERKLAPGIRRWSVIGGFDGVRVADVEMNTPTTKACRELKEAIGRSLSFSEMQEVCRSQNINDPTHLAFCVWYAKQPQNRTNPLYPLSWPWWELDREIGLPDNPMDGRIPF